MLCRLKIYHYAWALLPLLLGLPVNAQGTAAVSEYAVKSALLFKLPQFVYLPGLAQQGDLSICLLGSNPFGGALEKLAQMPLGSRPVKYLHLASAADSVAGDCDFIFISRSEAGHLDNVLRSLGKVTAVTVSDIEGFARSGGMVELATGGEGSAISILINRKAALRLNIEFNAQLLRLAKVVEP